MIYPAKAYQGYSTLRLRVFAFLPAVFLLVLSFTMPCFSQRGSGTMTVVTPGSGRNILYGDLRVDESKAGADKPGLTARCPGRRCPRSLGRSVFEPCGW